MGVGKCVRQSCLVCVVTQVMDSPAIYQTIRFIIFPVLNHFSERIEMSSG